MLSFLVKDLHELWKSDDTLINPFLFHTLEEGLQLQWYIYDICQILYKLMVFGILYKIIDKKYIKQLVILLIIGTGIELLFYLLCGNLWIFEKILILIVFLGYIIYKIK
jgi:hypothetical protein